MRLAHLVQVLLLLAWPLAFALGEDFVKPSDNAALQYWQAFVALGSDADTLRAVKPGTPWAQNLLSQNEMALKYFRRGAAMPKADWGLALEGGLVNTPHVERARHLAQAALLAARQAAHEQRHDEALQITADVFVLARHTATDGLLSELIDANEIERDAIQQVAGQLAAAPADALDRFAARLKALPTMPTFATAMRLQVKLLERWAEELAARQKEAGAPPDPAALPFAQFVRAHQRMAEIAELPPDQWPRAEAEYRESLRARRDRPALNMLPGVDFKHQHLDAQTRVQFGLLEAAVAVTRDGAGEAERFTDPLMGKPIEMQRLDDGSFELISEVPIEGKNVSLRVAASRLPATAPAPDQTDIADLAARVFRTMATLRSTTVRVQLSAADAMDEKARAELTQLLDEYEAQVAAQAEEIRRTPVNIPQMSERVGEMGFAWEADVMDKWLLANPDAADVLDDVDRMFQAITDTVLNNRQQVVEATLRAGLPEARRNDARKIVDIAYDGFRAYADAFRSRQEQQARLPENDPKRLQSITALADWEMKKLELASGVRNKLRNLLPADRRAMLDEELAGLAAR